MAQSNPAAPAAPTSSNVSEHLPKQTTIEVDTKVDKDSKTSKRTRLTIVWEGADLATVRALAAQQLVVRRQGWYRKHGIPDHETVRVADYRPGARVAEPINVDTMTAKATVMTPAERAEYIKRLQAMDAGNGAATPASGRK